MIGGFINTLDETYAEEEVTEDKVPVYAHSYTKVKVSYTVQPTVYTFYRVTTKMVKKFLRRK